MELSAVLLPNLKGFEIVKLSGFDRNLALKVFQPLATETLANGFEMDTAEALTGPIARGDVGTLKKQLDAITEFSDDNIDLFKALSRQALDIAKRKSSPPDLQSVSELLG